MDQTQPGRPDLSDDDLQRSPEQDPDSHRHSSAVLQEAIAAVVARCQGWSLDDAMQALQDALAERGSPPQPRPWVEAVATDAIAGRTYVVSHQALDDTGLEIPAHDAIEGIADRDRAPDPA